MVAAGQKFMQLLDSVMARLVKTTLLRMLCMWMFALIRQI